MQVDYSDKHTGDTAYPQIHFCVLLYFVFIMLYRKLPLNILKSQQPLYYNIDSLIITVYLENPPFWLADMTVI